MKCGLLGQKLTHSYSPQIHNALADYDYSLFEVEPEDLAHFLTAGNFTGLNVTIPYKKSVIPLCARLSPIAEKLGAVNTIVRQMDGSLLGHNSDYFGFQSMLFRSGLTVKGKKVLVLGSGGASATATTVLKESGANVIIISRSGENNYSNLDLHSNAAVIVNTTPVGMYPHTGISPLGLSLFPKLEGVLDVIYNPARTQLLLDAESRGLIAVNGLWMLVAQAKESAEWFSNQRISNDAIESIYRKLQHQMENIVLIGMPGSGKTTVGKILAQRLNRTFVDLDTAIEDKAGMSIPEIFNKYGESEFRRLESSVIAEYGKQSSLIISTGGGCVTVEDNYRHLHQNGKIIWLQRDIASLPTDGRPLSQAGKLQNMYDLRKPLYTRFADCIVNNNAAIEDTIRKILIQEDLS